MGENRVENKVRIVPAPCFTAWYINHARYILNEATLETEILEKPLKDDL